MQGKLLITAIVLTLVQGGGAAAGELKRVNWVPTGDYFFDEGSHLGDMWTFKCPKGGTVSISVDTADDNGDDTSNIDPKLFIFDGTGALLANPDDEIACSFPPVCGASCPRVIDLPCGGKDPHAVTVVNADSAPCVGGAEYRLTLEVKDKNGVSLPEQKVQLGGGAKLKLPKWLDPQAEHKAGPALDDATVPVEATTPLF